MAGRPAGAARMASIFYYCQRAADCLVNESAPQRSFARSYRCERSCIGRDLQNRVRISLQTRENPGTSLRYLNEHAGLSV
jgi:hypothetical protein